MALPRADGVFQVPTCIACIAALGSLAGWFCLQTVPSGPLTGEPGRVVAGHLAQGLGRLMPGAVPVAGAGHMRTVAEMSAGAASLATFTGRAVMGWRCAWAVHTCARGAFGGSA